MERLMEMLGVMGEVSVWVVDCEAGLGEVSVMMMRVDLVVS